MVYCGVYDMVMIEIVEKIVKPCISLKDIA